MQVSIGSVSLTSSPHHGVLTQHFQHLITAACHVKFPQYDTTLNADTRHAMRTTLLQLLAWQQGSAKVAIGNQQSVGNASQTADTAARP